MKIRSGEGFSLLHKNGWISNYSFYAMHEAEEFREKQMYPESYTVIRVKVSHKQKKPHKGQLLDVIGAVRRCKYALKELKGMERRIVVEQSMRLLAEGYGVDFDAITYEGK